MAHWKDRAPTPTSALVKKSVWAVLLAGAMTLNVGGFVQNKGAQVPAGSWGGDRISMLVTDKGAQLEFDCAHGVVEEPLILDGSGGFEAKGSYLEESPGPRREDSPARSKPARYAGRIKESTMTLTITLAENAQTIGTFTLTKDRTPRITKCG